MRQQVLRFNISKDIVHVVHNGLDCSYYRPARFSREKIRKELEIPLNAKVVLVVARLHPQKRHDLVLKVASQLKSTLPSLRLIFNGESFGQTGYEDSIRERARALRLADRVKWIPFVPDVRPLYSAADTLVLCSDQEAFPRCVTEAMAMQLPVVVTDSGGQVEVVKNGETGLVVRAGHVSDLARCILEVLTDESLCVRMTKAARDYVAINLSLEGQVDAITRIYEQLLASKITAGHLDA